jgi:dihydrolipoamide dehydrogenase
VGATDGRFSGTARLSELPKTETYTRAYAESKGFLTLLSDGQHLTGRIRARPRGRRVASAGNTGDSRPRTD